jgi:hypothetical protein
MPPDSVVVSAAVLIVVLRMCASDDAVPRVANIPYRARCREALYGRAGQAAGWLGLRLAQRVFGQEAPALMLC